MVAASLNTSYISMYYKSPLIKVPRNGWACPCGNSLLVPYLRIIPRIRCSRDVISVLLVNLLSIPRSLDWPVSFFFPLPSPNRWEPFGSHVIVRGTNWDPRFISYCRSPQMERLAHTITNYTNSARDDGPMGFGWNPSPFFGQSRSYRRLHYFGGGPFLNWFLTHQMWGRGNLWRLWSSEPSRKERWLYPSHHISYVAVFLFFSVLFSVFQIYPPT
jgi:hypothetical protein